MAAPATPKRRSTGESAERSCSIGSSARSSGSQPSADTSARPSSGERIATSSTARIFAAAPDSKASTADGEHFTRLAVRRQLAERRGPSGAIGKAQAIELRVDALVEPRERRHRVLRRPHRQVAQQPEKGGFFRVLGDDPVEDQRTRHEQRGVYLTLAFSRRP